MGLFSRDRDVPTRSVPATVVESWPGRDDPDGTFDSANLRFRFTAVVRLQGSAATVEVGGRLPFRTGWLMGAGDEIRVLVDERSGRVLGFDADDLERVVAPRHELYAAESRRRGSLRYGLAEDGFARREVDNTRAFLGALRRLPGQWRDAVTERPEPGGGLAPDDPALAPIEGVAFETWVAVQAALVRDRVPRDRYDEVARHHGVPPGRWPDVERAWRARLPGNPGLAQRFGEAYQQALKG